MAVAVNPPVLDHGRLQQYTQIAREESSQGIPRQDCRTSNKLRQIMYISRPNYETVRVSAHRPADSVADPIPIEFRPQLYPAVSNARYVHNLVFAPDAWSWTVGAVPPSAPCLSPPIDPGDPGTLVAAVASHCPPQHPSRRYVHSP